MSVLTTPGLTISSAPNEFSAVYGPNWWTFTPDFTNTTAVQNTCKVFTNVEIYTQNFAIGGPFLIADAGRFKVPIRTDQYGDLYFVLNTQNILKSFVTFPYDSGNPAAYDSGPAQSINECVSLTWSGFFPYVAPEPEGIVRYRLNYGIEYDPDIRFQQLIGVATASNSLYFCPDTVNYFCQVGDVVTVSPDSGLYQYWAGTASIIGIFDDGFSTYIQTDQIPDTDLVTSSGGIISGAFSLVQHSIGQTGDQYAYNGVRQWNENTIDLGKVYAFKNIGTFSFLNDYGKDKNHCIPIMPGQGERTRFLADLQTGLTGSMNLQCNVYGIGGTVSTTTNTSLQEILAGVGGGAKYTNKCFTVQLFDQAGTLPVIDGYKYQFIMQTGVGAVTHNIAEIWYVGYNPINLYNNHRIKFLNRQGTWCYWNFNKDAKQTTQVARTEYIRPLQYDYTIDKSKTGYSTSKLRGNAVLSTSVYEEFTFNTDWITEDAYAYLAQLTTSPEVYIFYDTYTQIDGTVLKGVNIPLIITDSSYSFKTTLRDKLFNLTINCKYAFGTQIQNQ